MKTQPVPFKIYIPATEDTPAREVDEIIVDIIVDSYGNEALTPESSRLIEKTQARHMGMMTGEDIKALRKRLGFTQDQLVSHIKCGKKSLSRWENGKGYPSAIINTILRLLDEGHLSAEALKAVDGPRIEQRGISQLDLLRHQSVQHKGQRYYNYLDSTSPSNIIPFEQLAS